MIYDYRKALCADIERFIFEEYTEEDIACAAFAVDFGDNPVADTMYDALFLADDVTGNGSGSYTFSAYRAQKNLCGNLELLCDALDEFGADAEYYKSCLLNPEKADVVIRCYLLPEMLSVVLADLNRYYYTDGVRLYHH